MVCTSFKSFKSINLNSFVSYLYSSEIVFICFLYRPSKHNDFQATHHSRMHFMKILFICPQSFVIFAFSETSVHSIGAIIVSSL
jgi:hypothetical protein